jgi:hypothetical protein
MTRIMNKFDNHSLFSDIVAANDDSIGGPMCNLLFFFEAKTASLVSAKLRPINASASAGIAAELGRVRIEVRALGTNVHFVIYQPITNTTTKESARIGSRNLSALTSSCIPRLHASNWKANVAEKTGH